VDEASLLADTGEKRQTILGIALVIRPAANRLDLIAHYNDDRWPTAAVESFLDGLTSAAAELAGRVAHDGRSGYGTDWREP
jgi:hypothetical protein